MRAWAPTAGRRGGLRGGMGILPMRPTGILPVDSDWKSRAKMALRRTGKMPVPRASEVLA